MQAAPGDSLAIPTFVCDTEICGNTGIQDLTDTVEFNLRLESFRGRGPNICVKKGYAAFKGSYVMAEDSLKKLVTQYINADIRARLPCYRPAAGDPLRGRAGARGGSR